MPRTGRSSKKGRTAKSVQPTIIGSYHSSGMHPARFPEPQTSGRPEQRQPQIYRVVTLTTAGVAG